MISYPLFLRNNCCLYSYCC